MVAKRTDTICGEATFCNSWQSGSSPQTYGGLSGRRCSECRSFLTELFVGGAWRRAVVSTVVQVACGADAEMSGPDSCEVVDYVVLEWWFRLWSSLQ